MNPGQKGNPVMSGRLNLAVGPFRTALFFFLFALLFAGLGLHHPLFLRPQSLHQWAQCDRASVAYNFAQVDMNLFLPRVHNVSNGSGITGMEFPIVNWIVAILYKLFGFHEFLYRLFSTVLIAVGLFGGAHLGERFTGSFWMGVLLVFIFFLSPILNFYTANFLPDTASLSFTLLSWYFFFRFRDRPVWYHAILWALFVSLAGLVKISAMLNLVAVLLYLVIDAAGVFRRSGKMELKWMLLIGALNSLVLVFLWYIYADHLNSRYGSSFFTLRMHPAVGFAEVIDIWRNVRVQWLPYYYNEVFYVFLAGSYLVILLEREHADPDLFWMMHLLYGGVALYVLLFLRQFRNHDYYIIVCLTPVFFHLILITSIVHRLKSSVTGKGLYLLLLAFVLLYSFQYSRSYQRRRYREPMNASFARTRDYMDLESALEKLGVDSNQRIVSFGDDTPNVTLYLMNRNGVSVTTSTPKEVVLKSLKASSFAVVNNLNEIAEKPYRGYFSRLVGVHGGLSIFAIPESPADPAMITKERLTGEK